MDTLIQIAQFILSLSILIVLHELGHFIPARLFKTRVEKFYLFFNPWFSLFKKKIGQTEYGLGWLPLGGYVKIAGMVDESMDKRAMKEPPKPDEFRSKKAWQRLIIMIGGVTVNFILGILIYIMILGVWGERKLPAANLTYGIAADSTAETLGFKDGDKIVALDGRRLDQFGRFTLDLILHSVRKVEVERDGHSETIHLPKSRDLFNKINESLKTGYFVEARFPGAVDSVTKDSPAEEAGLTKGDKLVALDSIPTPFYHDFNEQKLAHRGDTVVLTVLRGMDTVNLTVAIPAEDPIIGFQPVGMDKYLDFDTTRYGLAAVFPAGFKKAMSTLEEYWLQVKLIVAGKVPIKKSVGGFISIGRVFTPKWDWEVFWRMTAWLSLVLAFMNLLPIPALDGGHVMFLLFEVVTGKRVPDKVLEYAQVVGMVLLLALIIFANGADIIRLFD
jgi:regulator of sigma E protease